MAEGIYLLHFDPPLHHAKHYLGWAADIKARFGVHLDHKGSPLVSAAVKNGSEVTLARTWEGAGRGTERRLKKRKNLRSLCPLCREVYNKECRDRMRRLRRAGRTK